MNLDKSLSRPCKYCGTVYAASMLAHEGVKNSTCPSCGVGNYFSRVKRLDIGLSEVCNLSCNMCRRPQEREAIPREKVHRILREAAEIGVETLSFSGGEPFIYPGFRECLRLALDLGMNVEIVTNGTLLQDEDFTLLQRVKCVTVSVDGPEAEHDFIRGKPGCWRRTMTAIDRLAGSHVTWGTNSVMQGANADKILEIWRQVRSRGRPSYVGFGHVEVVPETAHLQMSN